MGEFDVTAVANSYLNNLRVKNLSSDNTSWAKVAARNSFKPILTINAMQFRYVQFLDINNVNNSNDNMSSENIKTIKINSNSCISLFR